MEWRPYYLKSGCRGSGKKQNAEKNRISGSEFEKGLFIGS